MKKPRNNIVARWIRWFFVNFDPSIQRGETADGYRVVLFPMRHDTAVVNPKNGYRIY